MSAKVEAGLRGGLEAEPGREGLLRVLDHGLCDAAHTRHQARNQRTAECLQRAEGE